MDGWMKYGWTDKLALGGQTVSIFYVLYWVVLQNVNVKNQRVDRWTDKLHGQMVPVSHFFLRSNILKYI